MKLWYTLKAQFLISYLLTAHLRTSIFIQSNQAIEKSYMHMKYKDWRTELLCMGTPYFFLLFLRCGRTSIMLCFPWQWNPFQIFHTLMKEKIIPRRANFILTELTLFEKGDKTEICNIVCLEKLLIHLDKHLFFTSLLLTWAWLDPSVWQQYVCWELQGPSVLRLAVVCCLVTVSHPRSHQHVSYQPCGLLLPLIKEKQNLPRFSLIWALPCKKDT